MTYMLCLYVINTCFAICILCLIVIGAHFAICYDYDPDLFGYIFMPLD